MIYLNDDIVYNLVNNRIDNGGHKEVGRDAENEECSNDGESTDAQAFHATLRIIFHRK